MILAMLAGCAPKMVEPAFSSMANPADPPPPPMMSESLDTVDTNIAANRVAAALELRAETYPGDRWDYAGVLYRSGRYRQAAVQYEQLVDDYLFGDAAVYLSWRCQYAHLLATAESKGDMRFIMATERLMSHSFGRSAGLDVPDFGPMVERRRAALLFEAAELLRFRDQDEAAHAMYNQVITEDPNGPRATLLAARAREW